MNKVDWTLINFPLSLAPMVGLSHIVLREIIQSYMPADALTIWPSEMLNSRRVPGENLATTPETLKLANETYYVPQILGNEEKPIQETIKKLQQWGAHGIDINMGCPVQKALKHNYGVALMGDIEYAAGVVRMAAESSVLPVSVKLRAIESQQSDVDLIRFVGRLIEAGAGWICLHPRVPSQQRRGVADWEQIKLLKQAVNVPIIGNGDIQTAADVWRMKNQTGCDLVMAGRALAARPWMAAQIADDMGFNVGFVPRTKQEEGHEYGLCLLKFIQLSRKYFGESLALRKINFYLRMTTPWLEFGHSLIGLGHKAKSTQELEMNVIDFFKYNHQMSERTELRL
ncbi:MAG: tRNA-dihydrouridine synthase family protein [Bdellovibrionaceae bacterium]|nr:tRNA-dihydrouridine synthase family protein [Pseudobdellovibrionaceae bacterium]